MLKGAVIDWLFIKMKKEHVTTQSRSVILRSLKIGSSYVDSWALKNQTFDKINLNLEEDVQILLIAAADAKLEVQEHLHSKSFHHLYK